MELLDGDQELLAELLEIFTETLPQTLTTIEKSIESVDLAGIRNAAHSLKGSSANLGAERIRHLAAGLETAVLEEQAGALDVFLIALREEHTAFLREAGL